MMLLAFLLLAAAQSPVVAPEPTLAQAAQVVRAGTPVRLMTDAPVHSRSIVQGQRIALRVADDVILNSKIVIPRGTAAIGEIESLSDKGMFGKAARFTLRPLFVEHNGRRLNLSGIHREAGSKATAAAAVTTVLIGGLGLIITGKSADLPQGSILHAELRDDVVLGS
jgi:hypothetical protein